LRFHLFSQLMRLTEAALVDGRTCIAKSRTPPLITFLSPGMAIVMTSKKPLPHMDAERSEGLSSLRSGFSGTPQAINSEQMTRGRRRLEPRPRNPGSPVPPPERPSAPFQSPYVERQRSGLPHPQAINSEQMTLGRRRLEPPEQLSRFSDLAGGVPELASFVCSGSLCSIRLRTA
jgi:hypothetical protein